MTAHFLSKKGIGNYKVLLGVIFFIQFKRCCDLLCLTKLYIYIYIYTYNVIHRVLTWPVFVCALCCYDVQYIDLSGEIFVKNRWNW
jgi:hypothetical protein